jgi:hypothetical protein
MALRLIAPNQKFGSVVAVVFFHRRGSEGAESEYFSFAFLSKANEKKRSICALRASAVKFKIIPFSFIFHNGVVIRCQTYQLQRTALPQANFRKLWAVKSTLNGFAFSRY